MLTSSERLLTTHASPFVRAATETGSRHGAREVEDGEPIVGRVHDQELRAVRRHRRGVHVAALEVHEVRIERGVRDEPRRHRGDPETECGEGKDGGRAAHGLGSSGCTLRAAAHIEG
jgi:hypothetical protein